MVYGWTVNDVLRELARGWITLNEAVCLYARILEVPYDSVTMEQYAILKRLHEGFESVDDAAKALG